MKGNNSIYKLDYKQLFLIQQASKDELKNFANEVKSKTGGGGDKTPPDPDDPRNKDKISEWEAGWNITNAIQVRS